MLTFTDVILKSATLGGESLIPDIHDSSANPFFNCDESMKDYPLENLGKGMVKTTLPYKMQNMYTRTLEHKKYKAAILENDCLKAVFLPELGGRLWKCYDKKAKRDIVYENDAVIFANLGYSNVWFAGGVEFNVGMRGHSAFGCRSLFTRKLEGVHGNDILQMYEYEEKRGVVYCINATLDGDKLLIRPEIHNVSGNDTYMYWWSNIAVAQTDNTRTFVPAAHSYITSYREGGYYILHKDIPFIDGKEITTCASAEEAIDYFYDIPEDNKKWICSLDEKGQGLLHTSTNELIGRKNFLWGQNAGGRHWNEWLTVGRDYYEIQAGLLKTQFEHYVMEKGTSVSWTEVYKGIDIGTNRGDFFEVCDKISEYLVDADKETKLFEVKKVCPLWHLGGGGGYIASLYRGKNICDGFEFPKESVGKPRQFYVDLFDGKDVEADICTDFTSDIKVIEFLRNKKNKNWFEDYILALGEYEKDNVEAAYELLKKSVDKKRHYLNLTALALYEDSIYHNREKAYILVNEAIKQRPDYYPLACVYGEIGIRAEKYEQFCKYYENAPQSIKESGRMKMYVSQCCCCRDMLDVAESYLNENLVVPDVREGEYSMSNVWVMIKRKRLAEKTGVSAESLSDIEVLKEYPVPYNIDFRMHPQK